MFMTLFIIFLIAAVLIWLSFYLGKRKKTRLLSEGKIIERKTDFLTQEHRFTTVTSNLEDIGNALNKTVFGEEKISFEPNYGQGVIVFHKGGVGGTFGAALRSAGQDGSASYRYRFQVEAYREQKLGVSAEDVHGANVLLTAIERAFMQLDPGTSVQRVKAEYKTKSKFF
jgi:hypothetical protein